MVQHRNGNARPYYVQKAHDDGYSITHMALLVQCPIPSIENHPKLRVVLLAMEAVFTGVFWALYRRDIPYGLRHICPWSIQSLGWTGLCSHSPLLERVQGRDVALEFTSEQIQELEQSAKDRHRLHNVKQQPKTKLRQQAAVSSNKYHCPVCNVSCRDNASLLRHLKTPRHLKKTVMGDNDYRCIPCNLSFRFLSDFNRHKLSKTHIANSRN